MVPVAYRLIFFKNRKNTLLYLTLFMIQVLQEVKKNFVADYHKK